MTEHGWFNVSLKIFLKNSKDEILCLKARSDSTMAGFYDLPGGRTNEDEFYADYKTIIKRELREEIGPDVKYKLSLKPVSFGRHSYYSKRQGKDVQIFFVCLEAKYLSGEIKISVEHTDMKWLDLHQIKPEKYFIKGPLEVVKRYLEF